MNPNFGTRRSCDGPVQLKDILRDLGIDKGRPDREYPITKDEILDLKINLNTTKDVKDFLALIN